MDTQTVQQKSSKGNSFAVLQALEDVLDHGDSEIALREQPSSSQHLAAGLEMGEVPGSSQPLGVFDPGPSQTVVAELPSSQIDIQLLTDGLDVQEQAPAEFPSNQIGVKISGGLVVAEHVSKGVAHQVLEGVVSNVVSSIVVKEPAVAGGSLPTRSLRAKEIVDLSVLYEAGKVVAERTQMDNSLMQTMGSGREDLNRRVANKGCMVTRSRGRSAEDPRPLSQ